MLFLKHFFPELQVGTRHKELLDIDSSSVILEDGITKLNTIGHYEVRTRASPAQTGLDPVQDHANSLKITRFPPVSWNHLKIACFRGRSFPYLLVVWDLLSQSGDFHGSSHSLSCGLGQQLHLYQILRPVQWKRRCRA